MDVDVEAIWTEVEQDVRQLQAARRLPSDGELYDSHLEVIKDYLRYNRNLDATKEAQPLARTKPESAFLAYELLKGYYIAWGRPDLASKTAAEAAKCLAEYERRAAKLRKKRGY